MGGVGGRWAIGDLGQDATGVLWRGVRCPSRLGAVEAPRLVTVFSEVPPLGECRRDAGSSEDLVERPAPRHLGAPDWARFLDPDRQEFLRYPGHGPAWDLADPPKKATAGLGAEGVGLELGEESPKDLFKETI